VASLGEGGLGSGDDTVSVRDARVGWSLSVVVAPLGCIVNSDLLSLK